MIQLPNYERLYADLIKEGIINSYLERKYGVMHGRETRLTALSDQEYSELISDLQNKVNQSKSITRLQQEAARKVFVKQILGALSGIGVTVVNGDYSLVNYHIRRLPIAKGRIIPQFRFEELERLLGAVRAYCDNIVKQQQKERLTAFNN
ncbi:MAG: hypothetical protein LUD46_03165 [Parabacteroides sp.]|nr:hypothetical protein [Parabacteroides sp.]